MSARRIGWMALVAACAWTGCAREGTIRRVDDGARIPLEIRFDGGSDADVVATLPDGERLRGELITIEPVKRSSMPLQTPWGVIPDEGPPEEGELPRAAQDDLLIVTARGEAGTDLRCVTRPRPGGHAAGLCLDSRGTGYTVRFPRTPVMLPGTGDTLGPPGTTTVIQPVP